MKNNKIFVTVNSFIKLIIQINVVLGVSLILYFTDFVSSINNVYSIYYDLLEPYIELIRNVWNQLMNYFHKVSTPSIKKELESILQESATHIQQEVKEGIKAGMKEALDEVMSDLQAANAKYQSYFLLKKTIIISSILFGFYFVFILPGPSMNPEDFTQYNWLNQSLIELKIYIKEFFINGGNGGNPNMDGGIVREMVDVANSPITLPKTLIDVAVSPITPGSGIPTLTPNSPIITALTEEEASLLKEAANNLIKNIKD